MALADAVQGAKRPSQLITWTDEDGDPLDLTNATITARIYSLATQTASASDGTFIVTDATGGVFRWDYGTNDLATAGHYQVQFSAAYGSDPTPAKTFKAPWRVHPAI